MAPDPITRLSAKYGIPEWIVRGMVKFEGGTNADGSFRTSPAGARGPAQLMPGTAAGLERRYGIDTDTYLGNLEGGVAYLGEQYRRFGGDPAKTVAAYNAGPGAVQKYGGVPPYAETQKYVKNILGGQPSGGGGAASAHGLVAAPPAPSTPQQDPKRQFTLSLLGAMRGPKGQQNQALLNALFQLRKAKRAEAAAQPVQLPQFQSFSRGNADDGWMGSKQIADSFLNIGLQNGLKMSSAKRPKMTTKTGGVSDHWEGAKGSYAYDFGDGYATPQMDATAHQIARSLGHTWDGKSPLELTANLNGYRVQVLYRTMTGGDHFDHIHVGVRRA